MIDDARDASYPVTGDQRTRLGVQLGDRDERLGYWLYDKAPGEPDAMMRRGVVSQLVPRERVIHLFRRIRPGQVRGVPIFAPVLMGARDFADLMDALVVKSRLEASIGLVIKSMDGQHSVGQALTDAKTREPLSKLRPGAIHYLRSGEEAQPFAPASNTAFEPIAIAALQGIAAGIGLTYDQLTGDLRQANYSSLRAGKIEFRRLIADLQWNMLAPQVIDRIVPRFIERAILAGLLPDRRAGFAYKIVMPAHEPIDPKKDLEADILAVRAGRMSPQDFIEGWGRDWREVLAEYEAFLSEVDEAGLVFDIDARQRTRVGQPTEQQQHQPSVEPEDAP
jgi:lambda family phage portal protein